ncbi:MAG: hypothetical protein WHX52_04020 [Anaerolineae bacterium]
MNETLLHFNGIDGDTGNYDLPPTRAVMPSSATRRYGCRWPVNAVLSMAMHSGAR